MKETGPAPHRKENMSTSPRVSMTPDALMLVPVSAVAVPMELPWSSAR